MSNPLETTATPCDLTRLTVAEFLSFYERRGYGHLTGFGRRPAVLVIDFSTAFTRGTPGFVTASFEPEIERTRVLLEAARDACLPICFTTIAYGFDMTDAGLWAVKIPWLTELKEDSAAVGIDERLEVRPDERVLVKKFPSSFFGTDLEMDLKSREVDTLILAGCTMSCCVRATAIDSMQRGFRTIIAQDAVGEFDPVLHAIHLADVRARYADVATVDELVPMIRSTATRVARQAAE